MSQTDDRVFVKKFSSIILGLIGITALIIVLAVSMRHTPDPAANPSQGLLAEERIAPVAGVHAGAAGEAAVAAVAAAEQAPAAGPADGKQIYESVCTACHTAGVAGAPQPGSDAFKQRLDAKGMDGLVASAINGLNVMPPRGGRPDLSDADIRAAITYMAEQPASP